jgi:hypothetical protein
MQGVGPGERRDDSLKNGATRSESAQQSANKKSAGKTGAD